jgi:lathosterol oxidase
MDYIKIAWWHILIGSFIRYILFAGMAYMIFYVWKRKHLFRFKIQVSFPRASIIKTELLYSFSTIVIFAMVVFACLFSPLSNYTMLYEEIDQYSIGYYLFSIVLVIFLHDTYFYWMHRLMHWKKIFPFVHRVHHLSHNPTPLAAFSFHPFEALLEAAVLPLIVFTVPLHPSVVGIFGAYMLTMNVIGHLGYELFPERFMKNKFFRHFTTSTHHNMHHHYGKGNYGLYFNFWDRLLGTNHQRYEEHFTEVSRKARETETKVGSVVR